MHCVIHLSLQDVQLTAANDDNYFVFEDIIYQVMLAFSRDTEVAETFSCGSGEFLLVSLYLNKLTFATNLPEPQEKVSATSVSRLKASMTW